MTRSLCFKAVCLYFKALYLIVFIGVTTNSRIHIICKENEDFVNVDFNSLDYLCCDDVKVTALKGGLPNRNKALLLSEPGRAPGT